eukprot:TRINITY_DN8088_c0_g1_i1.p1 TRINITY_DN8088_c0_g1~~TRINITY_DN8088_c0_g1_i1.p1  ORF type:complete len:103 (-),score=9.76 TRINITY_DN8088_c0_g1_i1:4-312(-)
MRIRRGNNIQNRGHSSKLPINTNTRQEGPNITRQRFSPLTNNTLSDTKPIQIPLPLKPMTQSASQEIRASGRAIEEDVRVHKIEFGSNIIEMMGEHLPHKHC